MISSGAGRPGTAAVDMTTSIPSITARGCPYKCAFCYWGGAIGQNAFVPMNLLRGKAGSDSAAVAYDALPADGSARQAAVVRRSGRRWL